MNRKVLMVNYYFPPHNVVAVFRALRFATHLGNCNWSPIILTCSPNDNEVPLDAKLEGRIPSDVLVERVVLTRPEERIKEVLRGMSFGHRRNGHVAVPTVSTAAHQSAAGSPTLREKISEFLFATPDNKIAWKRNAVLRGIELVSEQDVQVIYGSGPPFTALLVAAEISRKTHRPLVLDFRDPWSRCPWGPRMSSWYAQKRIQRLEAKVVRQASQVVLNTEMMASEFRSFYRNEPHDKFVSIPNGIDVDCDSSPTFEHSVPVSRQNRPFLLLHTGTLYGKRDPRPLFDAIGFLKRQGVGVRFEQFGQCDALFKADAYLQEIGLAGSIKLSPPVPHGEVLRRMSEADGFLLYQPGTSLQIPAKLFEMIPFRKPIVSIVEDGAASDIIQGYGLGTVGAPGNVESMAKAIHDAASNRGRLRSEGRWEAAMHDFDGRTLTKQLAGVFESVRPI